MTMIAQIKTPSLKAEVKRSAVTVPPIRIPGIQLGSGSIGRVKSVVPGIGTPINTPMSVLTNRIQADTFKVQLKLLPQGALSRLAKTTTATVPTQLMVNTVLSNRMTAIAKPIAHIHQVSGCSDSFAINYFLIRALGVAISTPHSFAG
jgi:hypothetical protein